MKDMNCVNLVCRLTMDPELRSLPSGSSVCRLRVAFSTSRKNSSTGEWEDRPNYCDVTVWGAQGENCARYLSKGRQIGVSGHLEWREWETREGAKRQSIDVVGDQVQFLGGGGGGEEGGGGGGERFSSSGGSSPAQDDFSSVPVAGADDDIPF
jgi:single-strand DNA-binding protein